MSSSLAIIELDVESWGDADDPVVVLVGPRDRLSADWRASVKALVEAGRHVIAPELSPIEPDLAVVALRRLLAEMSSRPSVLCAAQAVDLLSHALAAKGPPLAAAVIVVGGAVDIVETFGAPAMAIDPFDGPDPVEAFDTALVGFLEKNAPREAVVYHSGSDARTLRDALGCFATGVTVVTTRDGAGSPIGLTANSFSAVSLDPPLILFCLAKSSSNLARFRAAEHFAINVLHIGQQPTSGVFARSTEDRFQDVAWESWDTGAPILSGSLASFECATHEVVEAGDHLVFIGRVLRARFEPRRDPLLYFRGKYRRLHFA
ncbi:flavin reductase family protein [Brevundimonas sp.]|jgi:flavin reductase (DIM6/NTAB) family NADH-FMN oxidoreductase RutF|uniref:flavin reductase family protein n=1 Tax=Brevundimonas sp. TaxID=1871086 RepID=UPI0035AF29BB